MKLFDDLAKAFDEHAKKAACVIASVVQLGVGFGGAIFGQQTPPPAAGNEKKTIETLPPATPPGVMHSLEAEGGPIATKHIDSTNRDYNQQHILFTAKMFTNGYGNWGFYSLTPNSMRNNTYGIVYTTKPWSLPIKDQFSLELSTGLGAITGYEFPVLPMIFGEASLVLYRGNRWDIKLSTMAMPYPVLEDDKFKGMGVVVTSPVLGVRYRF